jgi:4-hydroxybenzoyl-CoA thioesterase
MLYHRRYPIEFNHCDPAGIVFYPRYFEMTNSVCENFFREVVGVSYGQMMAQRTGVPTVHIEVDFRAPSYLDDVLDVSVEVKKLGRSSLTFEIVASCGGQHRLTVLLVMCWMDGMAAAPWPKAMRAKLEEVMSA